MLDVLGMFYLGPLILEMPAVRGIGGEGEQFVEAALLHHLPVDKVFLLGG